MKTYSPKSIDPKAELEVETMLNAGASLDDAILRMRDMGLDKIDCIKLLRNVAHIPLAKGKDLVHLSPAWNDRLESDNQFHDQLIRVFETTL